MKLTGKRPSLCVCIVFLLLAALTFRGFAVAEDGPLPDAPQAKTTTQQAEPYGPNRATVRETAGNVLRDQVGIWTSPLHIRAHDLVWLLPLGAATGVAIATDSHTIRDVVTHDPDINNNATTASNVAIGGLIAAPVAIYGFGYFKHDDHARETGVLGAEAMLDGVVVEQGMKLIFWRERPNVDQQRGKFFQGSAGIDSSFPSSHAVIAFSSATVIASEYPNPLVQIGAYGTATGICVARLLGQDHFPGDLVVGGAAGWLVGRYVYRHHHRYDGRGHRVENALLKAAEVIQ